MGLDEKLKQELLDARENIIAQLREIEFRVTAGGIPRGRAGPPDYREVYAELKDQLSQINSLLEPDCGDDG